MQYIIYSFLFNYQLYIYIYILSAMIVEFQNNDNDVDLFIDAGPDESCTGTHNLFCQKFQKKIFIFWPVYF